MMDKDKLIEDFQRAFKFSRFEEQKTFGDARKWYVPSDVDKDMFKEWWPSGAKKPLFAAK